MTSGELKVGDRIKDNDPRMRTRILRVTGLINDRVYVMDSAGRTFGVARKRVYTHNKPRRTGFSKVSD